MGDYHEECDTQNKVILLDLANGAPTEETSNIIKLYDVDKDGSDIYKCMDKFLKPALVETAEYLNIDTASILKPELIRRIISKINSLLLEKCLKCNQYYTSKLEDQPVAICECGQPCHEPCYTELKEIFTNFPGIVFQCARCSVNKPAAEPVKHTAQLVLELPSSNDSTNSANEVGEKATLKSTIKLNVVSSFNLELLQARYPQPSYQICEEYKRLNCPHGRNGLTEVNGEQ